MVCRGAKPEYRGGGDAVRRISSDGTVLIGEVGKVAAAGKELEVYEGEKEEG